MGQLNKNEGKLYNVCKINTKIGLDFLKLRFRNKGHEMGYMFLYTINVYPLFVHGD